MDTKNVLDVGPSISSVCILEIDSSSHSIIISQTRTHAENQQTDIAESWLVLHFTWSGQPFTFKIAESDRYTLQHGTINGDTNA
jgi:hypothetical protein